MNSCEWIFQSGRNPVPENEIFMQNQTEGKIVIPGSMLICGRQAVDKRGQNRAVGVMWITPPKIRKCTTACQQHKNPIPIRVLAVIHTIHHTAAVTAVYYIFIFLKKEK